MKHTTTPFTPTLILPLEGEGEGEQTMALWKGRIEGKMSDVMKRMNNSLAVDIRLLPYDIRVNEVWAEGLKGLGILTGEELEGIKGALASLYENYQGGAFGKLPEDEDVHSLVERNLTEKLGDTGRKIHTGKSRNDQAVTDLMLFFKENVPELEDQVKKLVRALLSQSENHIHTILPGYTHMQQAQPITLAHYLLSLAYSLYGDMARLKNYTKNHLNHCPLGSGALAGTTLNISREQMAKKLGFEGPTKNSMQAVSDRAFVIDLASIVAIISMHLSRYAEDLIIWNSREFGFLKLADNVTTGSSMMPQKKNPDSLELIRGATGKIYGNLVGLLTITKGLPLSYAKDLQDDKKFIFESLDSIQDALALFTEVIEGVQFFPEKMLGAINEDALATDIADLCVEKGTPFRKAHETVGAAVKKAVQEDKPLRETLLKHLRGIDLDESSISPSSSLTRRGAIGGTSPSAVREQIGYLKEKTGS